MALHEEFDNTQDQLQWLKHLDKERQHLSASVEETLADPSSSQPDQWDDEAQPLDTSQKTALIPPRISLQSRVYPAAGATGTEQSLTGAHRVVAASQGQPTAETPQGQNVFKRIAQRLTAVFGSSDQHEEVGAEARQERAVAAEQPRKSQTALLPAISPLPATPAVSPQPQMPPMPNTSNIAAMPTMPPLPIYTPNERAGGPRPTVVDAVPSVRQPVIPVRTTEMADAETDTGKQKLAGWNTKVRLQAVSLPSRSAKVSAQPIEEVETKPDRSEVRAESAITGRGSLSGTDVFESGQREYVVKNANITATSVVQVMLTSNPGPVALHYVSLQPQVGFTIHLTGPATMKTAFNYVILLSELF